MDKDIDILFFLPDADRYSMIHLETLHSVLWRKLHGGGDPSPTTCDEFKFLQSCRPKAR